jgi:hypothetical protein
MYNCGSNPVIFSKIGLTYVCPLYLPNARHLGTDHVLVYFVVTCTFVWYNANTFYCHLLIPVICRYKIVLYQQTTNRCN